VLINAQRPDENGGTLQNNFVKSWRVVATTSPLSMSFAQRFLDREQWYVLLELSRCCNLIENGRVPFIGKSRSSSPMFADSAAAAFVAFLSGLKINVDLKRRQAKAGSPDAVLKP
jgi:hypothetical protein